MAEHSAETNVIGGVDTHKDLHVAAVVDHCDRVLGTESFPTTRHGYRLMLAWMRSFGDLQRVGVECSGSYGAGLLRYMQTAGVEILEVTTPDKLDRRRRGKNDAFDAESAAHAAFAKRHTVTPRTRDGMVESLRVLRVCRKTAVQARRIALQMIQMTIVCAPDKIRDPLRRMTRMQLIRTLASWRPDLTAYRQVEEAYRISLKSLARRYLELHDEIADLDGMIDAIVKDLAPELLAQTAIGLNSAAQLLLTAGDNPDRLRSEASFAALCGVSPVPASSGKTVRHRLNRGGDRAAKVPSTSSLSDGYDWTLARRPTCGPAHRSGEFEAGGNPLPQTLHCPRSLRHHYATTQRDQPKPTRRLTIRRASRVAQYTSEQFQRLMTDHGITCSMSRSGNVWDNAAMESFFSSLKTERTARKVYRTRDDAKADVFDYIERFYNPKRRHSTLGYLSPMEFENKVGLA